MIRIKMFRPFPVEQVRALCAGASRVGVIDRNYAASVGGIFCHEVRAGLQGHSDALVQGYLAGVAGSDVVPSLVEEVVSDLAARDAAGPPVWKGIEP